MYINPGIEQFFFHGIRGKYLKMYLKKSLCCVYVNFNI